MKKSNGIFYKILFRISFIWLISLIDGYQFQNDIVSQGYKIEKVLYERFLAKTLLDGYDKTSRPFDTTYVIIAILIKQIVSIDEKNQIMLSNCFVQQAWDDYRLSWNLTEYPGVKEIVIPAKSIWTPDSIIVNSAAANIFFSYDDKLMAIVKHDGQVFLSHPATSLQTRCKISVSKYPFDTQICSIGIGSSSMDNDQIYYWANESLIVRTEYSPNSLWEFYNLKTRYAKTTNRKADLSKAFMRDIYFDLYLKRKPLYFMINGIFPCLILNLITLFSFLIPFASQVALSIKILLIKYIIF